MDGDIGTEGAAPAPIIGSRGQMAPWEWRLLRAGTLFVFAFVILAVVRRNAGDLIGAGLFLAVTIGQLLVPPTYITADAIHRPWRKFSRIRWAEVDHLVHPSLMPYLQVILLSGQRISLTDIPVDRASDVAALGHTIVTGEPVRIAPVSVREPTAQQREADVARRAALLAAERAELAKRARPWTERGSRNHGGPPDDGG